MNTKLIVLLFLLIIPFGSCQKDNTIDFTLYLNYIASFDSCKTFKISIDGKEKFTDKICYNGIVPCYLTYTFPIASGNHSIKAEVVGESGIFEGNIEFVKSQKYGYLDYRPETGEFSFYLSSTGGID
jgi:hypothetical protein